MADNGVGLANSAVELPKNPRETATGTPVPARLPAAGLRNGSGIGLTNLRARLVTLYGTHQQLELASAWTEA